MNSSLVTYVSTKKTLRKSLFRPIKPTNPDRIKKGGLRKKLALLLDGSKEPETKMIKSPQAKKIERLIAPTAESMGYEIVRILMVGVGSGKPTLQIMAEKQDGTMDIEDCSRLSQAVSALLDVEKTIEEAYLLEVSSPGIDRPLTRAKDFERYKGHDVRIETDEPIGAQKKFKGMLKGLDEQDNVILETDKGDIALPLSVILKAKLLLTDELIKIHQQPKKQRKKG